MPYLDGGIQNANSLCQFVLLPDFAVESQGVCEFQSNSSHHPSAVSKCYHFKYTELLLQIASTTAIRQPQRRYARATYKVRLALAFTVIET